MKTFWNPRNTLAFLIPVVLLACEEGSIIEASSHSSRQESLEHSRDLQQPVRTADDIAVVSVRATPMFWPEINPCQFVRAAPGNPQSFHVAEMFSRRVSTFGGGVATFARLETLPESAGTAPTWVVFRGGATSANRSVSADVGLSVGTNVHAILSEETWVPEVSAYRVTAERVFVEASPDVLRTGAGQFALEGETVYSLRARASELDCELSWLREEQPDVERPLPPQWFQLPEDNGDGRAESITIHGQPESEETDVPTASE